MTGLNWDSILFLKINKSWSHPFLDSFLPVITDLHREPLFWLTVGLTFAFFLKRSFARTLLVTFGICLSFSLTDSISHYVIKSSVQRARPEAAKLEPILRTHSHSGYSFPSNHAANCFGIASLLGFVFPPLRGLFLFVALLVGYSRVYVGVHYPGDVLGGAILGIVISWFVFKVLTYIEGRFALFQRGAGFRELEDSKLRVRRLFSK